MKILKKRKFQFTKQALDSLPPHDPKKSAGNGTEYTDAQTRGLKAIIGPSGHISFLFRYTFNGRKASISLGEWPVVTIDAARKKVMRYRLQLDEGEDPKSIREEKKKVLTYREYMESVYLPQHSRIRKKSCYLDELKTKHILNPVLGPLRLDAITTRDIAALHNSEKDRTSPASANHVVRLISSSLNIAVQLGYLDRTKVPMMPKKFPEQRRDRYLSVDEISRFLKALEHSDVRGHSDALKMLLFTGCRKMEILSLRWENVRLDEEGAEAIYLPTTKNGQPRTVLLNTMAKEVLVVRKAKWDGKNPYVFPTKTGSRMPHLYELRRTFRRGCKEAGIDWMTFPLHGLRHTYAALVVSNGGTLYECQQLLEHLDQTTTQRYAHLASDALRKATEKVSARIEMALA